MGSIDGSGRGQSMEGKANYKKGESSTNMATVTLVTKDNNRLWMVKKGNQQAVKYILGFWDLLQFLELKVKIRNRSLKTTIANSARFEEVLVYGELFNNFVKYLIIKISRNQSIKISLIKFFKLTKFNFKPCLLYILSNLNLKLLIQINEIICFFRKTYYFITCPGHDVKLFWCTTR